MWSNVNATSRVVTGMPSWKRASGRSRKRAPPEVLGDHHRLGQVPVVGAEFVVAAHEQAVVEEGLEDDGHPGGRDALAEEGREAVPVHGPWRGTSVPPLGASGLT